MEGKTIAYEVFGRSGVLVHSDSHAALEEWPTFVDELRGHLLTKKPLTGLIVYSNGGAPTDNQRSDLMGLTRFHNVPTAVILEDRVQFIDQGGCVVGALNWTGNLNDQTFNPTQMEEAVDQVASSDREAVLEALRGLQAAFNTLTN